MASIFRYRGKKTWWVSYYLNGNRCRHSLKTTNEKIARRKLKRIEADLETGDLEQRTTTPQQSTGDLELPSITPLEPFLDAFCEYLETARSRKAYKNDLSYLRTFFGPVCEAARCASCARNI